jgi:Protein-disulfide isomerase
MNKTYDQNIPVPPAQAVPVQLAEENDTPEKKARRKALFNTAVNVLTMLVIFWIGFYTGVIRVIGPSSFSAVLVASRFEAAPAQVGTTWATAPLVPAGKSADSVAPVWTHGDKNAPGVMKVDLYIDYQCPYSAKFVLEDLDYLLGQKDVYLEIHDFPLDFHQYAIPAARLGRFIGSQYPDKYLAYLRNIANVVNTGNGFDTNQILNAATSLGISNADARNAIAIDAVQIKEDQTNGTALGINGTPTMIINGRLLSGYFPIDSFKQQISAARAAQTK